MQDPPRPPRQVRWRAALSTWWFAGNLAAGMLAGALLIAFALLAADDFRLPRTDWQLDAAGELAFAVGTVRAIEPARSRFAGGQARVHYEFTDRTGTRQQDRSWLRPGTLQTGDQCGVVYLPDDPACNRLRGGAHSLASLRLPTLAGVLLLPGLAVGLLWFSRAYRTWVLLRHGDGAAATLVAQRPLRGWPPRLRVRYVFAGDGGAGGEGWQDVRPQSRLGEALRGAGPGAPLADAFAVHDPRRPARCRLAAHADAEAGPA